MDTMMGVGWQDVAVAVIAVVVIIALVWRVWRFFSCGKASQCDGCSKECSHRR